MTEFKNLLSLLNEKIETTERMQKYYKLQLDRYEAIIDSLKDLRNDYLNRGKEEEKEEPEEEKKGE